MPEVVKEHKMKIVRFEELYFHKDRPACQGHVLVKLKCSCGYTKKILDPDYNDVIRRVIYEHTSAVVEAAGFVFELTE